MMQLRLPAATTRYDYVALTGGLDLLTPLLKLRSGFLRDAVNWECSITGGYSRSKGYERFDGRPAPSAAVYGVITCAITGAIAVGNTITGVTSGATGVVISITGNLVAYTKSTGSFVAAETINIAGTPRATVTSLGGVDSAMDWDARQTALAADVYRTDILAVPGSGPIRGGFVLNAINYAFRDNAGATALALYKSSGAGWVLVPFLYEVSFTAGSSEYSIGETITQGANSATVKGVSLESGAWSGTAAGRLIITQPTPGAFAAGAAAGGGAATLSGAATAITLLPGGRVETDKGNFGGGVKVYGADGVNRMWEFDGTALVPIVTTVTPDTPKHPKVFKDHLTCCFGAVFKHSGITTPYNWSSTAGGAEYRCAGIINATLLQPGNQSVGAMSLSLDDSTEMFYGTSAADFQKIQFEQSSGGFAYGAQSLGGQAIIFSAIGVTSMAATQNFGNFTPSSLTMNIRPFTQVRRNQVTASLVNREKSQYRVFFGDGYGLFMTMVNGRLIGSVPQLYPNTVKVAWAGATPDGVETAYFGSDNGMVYQMESGTSHDGASLESFMTLTFANQGNSRVDKRYRSADFEVQGEGYGEFNVSYEIDYGQASRVQGASAVTAALSLSPGFWDSGLAWDTLFWDGKNLAPNNVKIGGTGENIALHIVSNSTFFQPMTLNSVILHYSPRKAHKS